jgi:predicted transcriptional regulator
MDTTNYRLLERAVAAYDDTSRPVRPEALAAAVNGDVADVGDRLETLVRCDLLVSEGEGVRPTVTARELLALDIDEPEILVVDAGEDC